METLNNLCTWLDRESVFLFDRQLPFSNETAHALTVRFRQPEAWGIFLDTERLPTLTEKKTALLHECGHYATGATHELSSRFDLIEKHEYKANKWAARRAVSEEELDQAIADGCTEIWQLAERFEISEDLMKQVICWYTYGNVSTELYF
jgi:hypothetical protein